MPRTLVAQDDGAHRRPCAREAAGAAAVGRRSAPSALAAAWRPPGLAWAASFVLAVGLAAFAPTPTAGRSRATSPTHERARHARRAARRLRAPLAAGRGNGGDAALGRRARVEGPGTTGIFGIAPLTGTALGSAQSGELSPQSRARGAPARDARVLWVEPLTEPMGPRARRDGARGNRNVRLHARRIVCLALLGGPALAAPPTARPPRPRRGSWWRSPTSRT